MANFVFEVVDTNLVVVMNTESPLMPEWEAYLEACRQLDRKLNGDFNKAAALIFTDGGAPNAAQRRGMVEVLKGRPANSAVVSDNMMVRGPLSILSLFNPALKVFNPKDWKQAATFARIPEARHLEHLQVALKLSRQIGDLKVLRAIGL